jgi:hypothetical protein
MLCGGGDSPGDHLLLLVVGSLVEQLTPEVLQPPQRLGRHGEPAPALGGAVEHRPDQRQAALLSGQPADHLDPAAGLAEGALDQVGVADALAVLAGEAQVDQERVEVVGDPPDRGGDSGFQLAMNRLARRRPSATAASPSCSIWSRTCQ